jgi:hypothetical protein
MHLFAFEFSKSFSVRKTGGAGTRQAQPGGRYSKKKHEEEGETDPPLSVVVRSLVNYSTLQALCFWLRGSKEGPLGAFLISGP